MTKESRMRERFILIDDDPAFGNIMAAAAETMQIELHSYSSLLEVIYSVRLDAYDVAILDYDLGHMTGVEVAQYLDAFFKDIPVILVSSSDRNQGEVFSPSCVRGFVHKNQGYQRILAAAHAANLMGHKAGYHRVDSDSPMGYS